jgi:serine/threonine protein kinase
MKSITNNNNNNSVDSAIVDMQIAFGDRVFSIPLARSGEASLIKLADFGTSTVGMDGLGQSVTVEHFTTLENTAPEFLLLGSAARQSFASDTFALGLCFLHLLTGHEPYEEMMAAVHCPAFLHSKIEAIWSAANNEADDFFVIKQVVESLDPGQDDDDDDVSGEQDSAESECLQDLSEGGEEAGDEEASGGGYGILTDTLYRYVVLFSYFIVQGAQEDSNSSSNSNNNTGANANLQSNSPVWAALLDSLNLTPNLFSHTPHNGNGKKGGAAKRAPKAGSRAECTGQFSADVAEWSLRIGQNARMAAVRQQLQGLGRCVVVLAQHLLLFDHFSVPREPREAAANASFWGSPRKLLLTFPLRPG